MIYKRGWLSVAGEKVHIENKHVTAAEKHHLALTDIQNARLFVLDLDTADPLSDDGIVWKWWPDPALGWKYGEDLRRGLCGVKLRWSAYYQSYVVLMTSSKDWAGIAEYPSGRCLWENKVGVCPHSIEMLPNGDIVVACSGSVHWAVKGCLKYYNISAGAACKCTDAVLFPSAHGVLWDPQENLIWALGHYQLAAYRILDTVDHGPVLSLVPKRGGELPTHTGHSLSADYADSDMLWITTEYGVYKFRKSTNEMLTEYLHSTQLLPLLKTKSIVSFPDGRLAYCNYGDRSVSLFCNWFHVLFPQADGSSVTTQYVTEDGRLWYKMCNFFHEYL